jgi:hypothetical protein
MRPVELQESGEEGQTQEAKESFTKFENLPAITLISAQNASSLIENHYMHQITSEYNDIDHKEACYYQNDSTIIWFSIT